MWRDNDLECSDFHGNPISATKYLGKNIRHDITRETADMQHEAGLAAAISILSMFQSLECRQIPHPGGNPNEESTDLNPQFERAMQESIHFLLTHIDSKKGFNSAASLDGAMLANLARSYTDALNDHHTIPNLQVSWRFVVVGKLESLVDKLVLEYCEEMNQALQDKMPIREGDIMKNEYNNPPCTLIGFHLQVFDAKLLFLNQHVQILVNDQIKSNDQATSTTPHPRICLFKQRIVKIEDERVKSGKLHEFISKNQQLSQVQCKRVFDETFKQQQEIDLERLHSEYLKKARGPAVDEVYKRKTEMIPGPPQEVHASDIGDRYITLSWKNPCVHPSAAQIYEVQYKESQNEKYWTPISCLDDNCSLKIRHLSPNRNYLFRVCGTNIEKRGEFSQILETKTKAGKPARPSQPSVKPLSATHAMISVERLPKESHNGSIVNKFIIEFQISKTKWNHCVYEEPIGTGSDGPFEKTIDISNATERGGLYCRVRMANDAGESEPSDHTILYSTDLIPAPPQSLVATSVEARKCTIKWIYSKRNPATILEHLVEMKEEHNTNWTKLSTLSLTQNDCLATIGELTPHSSYQFRVRGVNKCIGETSQVLLVKTKPDVPNKPQKPKINVLNCNNIALVAPRQTIKEEHGSPITAIVVEKLDGATKQWKREKEHPISTGQDKTIIPLTIADDNDSATEYRIKSKNGAGESEPSDSCMLSADEILPGKPENLKIIDSGSKLCKIGWSVPLINPASVNQYHIEKKQGAGNWTPVELSVSNEETAATIEHITPNTKYFFRVCGCNSSGKFGEYSEVEVTTTPDAPNKPYQPSVEVQSQTTAILTIPQLSEEDQNGSSVTKIIIERSREQCSKFEEHVSIEPSYGASKKKCKLDISNLFAYDNMTVSYWIKMANEAGLSEPSRACDIEARDLIPGPPKNVHVAKKEVSTCVVLTWDKPEINLKSVDGYAIRRRNQGETNWVTVETIIDKQLQSLQVNDLSPSTQYEFQICAVNHMRKQGEYSTPSTIARTSPGKPEILNLKVTSSNKATVRFNNCGSKVTGIVVDRCNAHGRICETNYYYDMDYHDDSVINNQDIVISNDTHFVRVRFKSEFGESESSIPYPVATDDLTPGEPTDVKISHIKSRSLTLTWSKPKIQARAARKYDIEISNDSCNSWEQLKCKVDTDDNLVSTVQILNLIPNTQYHFRVRAKNKTNLGDPCDVLSAKTAADVPGQPKDPVVRVHDEDHTKAIVTIHRLKEEEEFGSKVTKINIEWSIDNKEWQAVGGKEISVLRSTSDMIIEEDVYLKNITAGGFKGYYFRLEMTNEIGTSKPSGNCLLPISALRPGQVENLRVTNCIEAHGINVTLQWDNPKVHSAIIPNCRYTVDRKEGNAWSNVQHDISDSSTTVHGLKSSQNYTFRVTAMNGDIKGPNAEISVTTNEAFPGPPRQLRCDRRQHDKIKVRWSKPDVNPEALHHYKVVITTEKKQNGKKVALYVGQPIERYTKGTSKVIKCLEGNTNYIIHVTSKNENNKCKADGSSTSTVDIKTKLSPAARGTITGVASVIGIGIGGGVAHLALKPDDEKHFMTTDDEYDPQDPD